jgi:HPt (histidine-containing phosphotransfer) domain-containing protein
MLFETQLGDTTMPAFERAQTARARSDEVFDLAHLRVYTMGIIDLEREILGLFLAELPKSQAALSAATTAKDWHMAAHTLKGSALAIGARALAALGSKAEATECHDRHARDRVISRIDAACADVAAEIRRLGLI